MSDVERDPTRTEDVEEADVKRSLEAHLTQAKAVSRLRRRADRLEEALEEISDVSMDTFREDPPRLDEIYKIARAALDSREDEGVEVHLRADENLPEETARALHDAVQELSRQPVHTDEPEGDERCPDCGALLRVHPVATTGGNGVCSGPSTTDEPVSREGEEPTVSDLVGRRRLCRALDIDPDQDPEAIWHQIEHDIAVLMDAPHADARSGFDVAFPDKDCAGCGEPIETNNGAQHKGEWWHPRCASTAFRLSDRHEPEGDEDE